MTVVERRRRTSARAALRRALELRDRHERVRRSIIAGGGSLGWLRGVTLDALRAGVIVQRLRGV